MDQKKSDRKKIFFPTKKNVETKSRKKMLNKKSPKKSKFSIFEKSRFSNFKIFKIFVFLCKILKFLKFQNFQNQKSPRLKNIFRSDFFYNHDIHLYQCFFIGFSKTGKFSTPNFFAPFGRDFSLKISILETISLYKTLF